MLSAVPLANLSICDIIYVPVVVSRDDIVLDPLNAEVTISPTKKR